MLEHNNKVCAVNSTVGNMGWDPVIKGGSGCVEKAVVLSKGLILTPTLKSTDFIILIHLIKSESML